MNRRVLFAAIGAAAAAAVARLRGGAGVAGAHREGVRTFYTLPAPITSICAFDGRSFVSTAGPASICAFDGRLFVSTADGVYVFTSSHDVATILPVDGVYYRPHTIL